MGANAQEEIFVSDLLSPLKFANTDTDFEGTTHFNGQVIIKGIAIAIRESPGEDEPPYTRLVFNPDEHSQRILPHEKNSGQVTELWLRNDEALSMLFPESKIKLLNSGKIKTLSGTAEIEISSFQTGIDCDQRGYNAILNKVITPVTAIVTNNENTIQSGC
jgi:hypothetical protein